MMSDLSWVPKLFSPPSEDFVIECRNFLSVGRHYPHDRLPALPIPIDNELHSFSVTRAKNKYTAIIDGWPYTLINGEWCKDE